MSRRCCEGAREGAHVEPLLRAQLLDEEDLRDAQLGADVRDDLAVDKVLLEAHVPGGGVSERAAALLRAATHRHTAFIWRRLSV